MIICRGRGSGRDQARHVQVCVHDDITQIVWGAISQSEVTRL
jgi:hypothetical protein